jgi:hypothetical protein
VGEGTITLSPTTVTADAYRTLSFQFTVGPSGLQEGGGLRLQLPCKGDRTGPLLWDPCQTESRGQPGYVEASAGTHGGARLRVRCGKAGRITLSVQNGVLSPGDTIHLTYSGNVQALARTLFLRVHSRLDADDTWRPLAVPPGVTILPGESTSLLLVTPSDLTRTAGFDLAVVALDRFGNKATGYRGTLSFSSTDPDAMLPNPYTFTPEDAGLRVFSELKYNTPGFQTVSAVDGALAGRSNYSMVHEDAELPYRRYFGDTHFHTGTGTGNTDRVEGAKGMLGDHRGNYTMEEEAYAYARDVMRLDFACASEHDGDAFAEDLWRRSQDIAESFYEPGSFATFFAYEWTSWETGHRLVLYKDYGNNIYRHVEAEHDTPEKLWAALDGQGSPCLVLPHPMGEWTDDFEVHPLWTVSNDECQRIGEIYSQHSAHDAQRFEIGIDNSWSFQHAWHKGHRIGLIGSSDNHLGTPGANDFTPDVGHAGGLAVVLAQTNDRDSVWESLENRRTYATTGTRIYLDFRIDGHHMGEEFSSATPPSISVTAAGTEKLVRVELIKHDSSGYTTIHAEEPEGDVAAFDYVDEAFSEDSFYYVRVTQADGEMAWSSPIWLEHRSP